VENTRQVYRPYFPQAPDREYACGSVEQAMTVSVPVFGSTGEPVSWYDGQ